MTDYKDALIQMSQRGTPAGSTALLDRVESDLGGSAQLQAPQKRWLGGPVLAAAVFVTIVAVGAVLAFALRFGGDSDHAVDALGVEWRQVSERTALPNSLTSGPNGFLRQSWGPDGRSIEFSADGESWSAIGLTNGGALGPGAQIASSDEAWLILDVRPEGSVAWSSTDGRTWEQVVWPTAIENTVSEVVDSSTGFLAISRDRFGAGTTSWRSFSGAEWVEVLGPSLSEERSEWIRGTSAGWIALAGTRSTGTAETVALSIDGMSWQTAEIPLPPEYEDVEVRWRVTTVERVDDTWIALGQMDFIGAEPRLHVWTSFDGIEWTSHGTPPFGQSDNRAVGIRQVEASGSVLVVAPHAMGLMTDPAGYVHGQGMVESTGELWATENGEEWVRVLDTPLDIYAFAVNAEIDVPAGLWFGLPRSIVEQDVVVTTAGPIPAQELDPAGIALRKEILADGIVSEEEYHEALEGWKRCMEARGIEGVMYELDARGGVTFGWASPEDNTGIAESDACSASYLDELSEALAD